MGGRTRGAWALALALCLGARAAAAVDLGDASLHQVLGARFRHEGGARWRDDDPDLIRGGSFARWDEALSEGAYADRTWSYDLDGDGVEERVARVWPRRDPAPQNERPGFVLFRREPAGWRARVLYRPSHTTPNDYDQTVTPSATLTRRRVGGQSRLFFTVEIMVVEENPSGHGHGSFPYRLRMPLVWRGDEPRAGGLCEYGYTGPWEGARLACRCPMVTVDTDHGASVRFPEHCAGCDAELARIDPSLLEIDGAPRPAWCRDAAGDEALSIEALP